MSSEAFKTTTDRRVPTGWRRSRVKGHLYEVPTFQRGHQNISDYSGAVHVEDCPKCATDTACSPA